MSREQRCDIENGIWMCYRHGKLIDTDETRFTIDMLRNWRKIAESRAQLAQELGGKVKAISGMFSDIPLVEALVELQGIGTENELIGDALADSCVPVLWGDELSHALRDFSIEFARNAFVHGKASKFTLDIRPTSLTLSDDGSSFDPWSLLDGSERNSGGITAMRQLVEDFGTKLVIAARRVEDLNEITISLPRSQADVSNVTPCTVTIRDASRINHRTEIGILRTCKVVYVILPRYFSPSDVAEVAMLRRSLPDLSTLVWVVEGLSAAVKKKLQEEVPGSKILDLSENAA
jgi:hypothetical protein